MAKDSFSFFPLSYICYLLLSSDFSIAHELL